MIKTYTVNTNENIRLDVFVSGGDEDFSRSRIKKLADDGKITVNGEISKASRLLKQGDTVALDIAKQQSPDLTPQDLPLDIVYQDADLAVINKPQGLTVHAGGGTKGDTLVNALLYHLDNLSGINGVLRPGIVHRIDKDTSGLLVVAKNDRAHLSLSKQIENKTCRRVYLALLDGVVKADSGTVDTFIGRHRTERKKMAVLSNGRRAVTHYKVVERYEQSGFTLVEFALETGRTHQIRVHAKHMGYPVTGDKVYGYKKQKFNLNGQLLHAYKLAFVHPSTGEGMEFTCPLPDYFQNILKNLQ